MTALSAPARTCGMPPPAAPGRAGTARARRDALELIRREGLIRPAIGFRIHAVDGAGAESLDVGGIALLVPGLAAVKGEITAIAAAACTLGPVLEARVSALFAERRPALALALDAAAPEALYGLSDRALRGIARAAARQGLGMGEVLNPGDPGIALDQQRTVLALACASDRRIAVTASGMLSPANSLSFIVALGPNLQARPDARLRCARCPSRDRCSPRAN